MEAGTDILLGLLAAIGGGLLVGTERERRKGDGADRAAIGVRTCSLASLTGAVSALLGWPALLVGGTGIVALTLAAYVRSREIDPGLTTELALLATFALGALAMSDARLAAALFVAVTIILASKASLHRFARHVLSERELDDALLLAASALIVMPLLPDRTIDPLGAINPRKLWLLAVLVMSINAAGHVALRALGPKRGLALSGLAGGFVSSTATIAGMAQRAREDAGLRRACIAGALLSNVATVVQLALILLAVAADLLRRLAIPLGVAALLAVLAAAIALRRSHEPPADDDALVGGRAFSLRQALVFVAIVAAALFVSALMQRRLGEQGALAAAAATGFADVHAASVAIAQLAATASLPLDAAALAVALAFTTNSLVKCAAAASGGGAFARPVVAGIVAIDAGLIAAVLIG